MLAQGGGRPLGLGGGGRVVVLAAGHFEAAPERDAAAWAARLVVLCARPVRALAALLLAAEQVPVHQQLSLALPARHERVTYTPHQVINPFQFFHWTTSFLLF